MAIPETLSMSGLFLSGDSPGVRLSNLYKSIGSGVRAGASFSPGRL
jgi:hypothetical protein